MVLGLDLGTSGVRVVALDAAGGEQASSNRGYPLLTPQPGWTEQRPQDWLAATLEALAEISGALKARGQTPLALGLSGQMHGLVALGAGGEVLRPAPLWNDARTGAALAEIEERVPRPELIARTGNRAVAGFQLPKLLWMRREEPELYARVRHALLPKDYLGYALGGELASEPSDASGVGALNLERRDWDHDVLGALEVSPSLFPPIHPSTGVVGRLKAELAGVTGLPAGLPIVAGGGDNAAAGIGLGLSAARPEVGSLSLGTSGVLFAPLSRPTPDPEGRVHLFAHADGGFHLLGVTLSCAGALQWLRDAFFPGTPFETLLAEAGTVGDGADGVSFLPYLSGERSPYMDPSLRGGFGGLSLSSGRPQLVRAVLEGTALALADAWRVMRPLSGLRELLATGGGARSDLWLGLMAGALELGVARPARASGAAEGAATLAMPAAGLHPDLGSALETRRGAASGVTAQRVEAARQGYASARARVLGAADFSG